MDHSNGDMQAIKRQIMSLNFDMNNLHQKASEATIRRLAREIYEEDVNHD